MLLRRFLKVTHDDDGDDDDDDSGTKISFATRDHEAEEES